MATVVKAFRVASADIVTTNPPELVLIAGTNFPVSGYALGDTNRENLYFQGIIDQFGASNTDVKANFVWYSRTGAVTNAASWGCALARYVAGTSVEALAFATAGAATSTVSATAKGATYLTAVSCTLPSGLTANDEIEVNVFRDGAAGGDTLVGDAVLTGFYLSYLDV